MNPMSRERATHADPYCKERAGFLFSHQCGNLAIGRCAACGKGICQEHQRPSEEGTVCIACAKARVTGAAADAGAANQKVTRSQYDNDPYFYSYMVYSGYGHYGSDSWGATYASAHQRDDFTAADGESTRTEGDEGFERSLQDS